MQSGEHVSTKLFARCTRGGVLVGCVAWTIISLVGGSGEIWIALHALDLQRDLD